METIRQETNRMRQRNDQRFNDFLDRKPGTSSSINKLRKEVKQKREQNQREQERAQEEVKQKREQSQREQERAQEEVKQKREQNQREQERAQEEVKQKREQNQREQESNSGNNKEEFKQQTEQEEPSNKEQEQAGQQEKKEEEKWERQKKEYSKEEVESIALGDLGITLDQGKVIFRNPQGLSGVEFNSLMSKIFDIVDVNNSSEIKKAMRRRVKEWHADVNGDNRVDEIKMSVVNILYAEYNRRNKR